MTPPREPREDFLRRFTPRAVRRARRAAEGRAREAVDGDGDDNEQPVDPHPPTPRRPRRPRPVVPEPEPEPQPEPEPETPAIPTTLYAKVRCPRDRHGQIQIPISIFLNHQFFDGMIQSGLNQSMDLGELVSRHDGETHTLSYTHRSKTTRVQIPELNQDRTGWMIIERVAGRYRYTVDVEANVLPTLAEGEQVSRHNFTPNSDQTLNTLPDDLDGSSSRFRVI